jgi:hypothetical protein
MRDPLLEVNGLKKHFPIRRGLLGRVSGHVYAVDGLFLFGHFNREHDRNFTILAWIENSALLVTLIVASLVGLALVLWWHWRTSRAHVT